MLFALGTVLANWIPDPSPDWRVSPVPYVILMLAGFVIGILGHLFKSKVMVAIGIGCIFLSCLVLPLATNLSKQ